MAGMTATPYGFTSPLAGTVETIVLAELNWPRNVAATAGEAAKAALAIPELSRVAKQSRDAARFRWLPKQVPCRNSPSALKSAALAQPDE